MKLSIITINYNNKEGIKDTIKSVVSQTFDSFEYIVIDGGSNDGSVEEIEKFQEKISYWVSEKDRGIYHAMNKGLAVANGEYVLMLNSGDCLYNNEVLKEVFNKINPVADIIYGDVVWMSKGKIFRKEKFPDRLTFDFFRDNSICHQATFTRKTVHDSVGYYDEAMKISSDWKFFVLAVCRFNLSYLHVELPVASCDCDGMSWKGYNMTTIDNERNEIFEEFFPAFIDDYRELDTLKSKLLKARMSKFESDLKKVVKNVLGYKKASSVF